MLSLLPVIGPVLAIGLGIVSYAFPSVITGPLSLLGISPDTSVPLPLVAVIVGLAF